MANTTTPSTLSILHYDNNHKHRRNLPSLTSVTNSLRLSKSLLLSFSSSSLSNRLCTFTRVSTAPLEYVPPAPDSNFQVELSRLNSLRLKLASCGSHKCKQSVVDKDSRVKEFFNRHRVWLSRVFRRLNLKADCYEVYLLKCLVAAGQEHVLNMAFLDDELHVSTRTSVKSSLYALAQMIENWDMNGATPGGLDKGIVTALSDEEIDDIGRLLKILSEMEDFYDCIGGVIGYQLMILKLLSQSMSEGQNVSYLQHARKSECQFLHIHAPKVLDLSEDTKYASQAALWGIEGLPDLGEIYPLGGSADRLGLVDPDTDECLPAAMLPYCGRTLLEGLIRDLQAREFLYYKMYGKQCITPVAIMTSSAKNNHKHVTSLCEKVGWFLRGRSNFKFFEQPLVPAVSADDGQWLVAQPFSPVCKPGGHGVIWKLASDKGIYQWFYRHGRKGATVRQVSNVVAATDLTLLALAGIGLRHQKKLGFASCRRNPLATEGVNVLIEKKNLDGKWAYGLSCIEYTEFDKFGITNGPLSSHRLQAGYPANTNILYVDLASAELVGSSTNAKSLPGMVLNTKKPVTYLDHFGKCHRVYGGRLECTMQNIADEFLNVYASKCYEMVEADQLDTFIVYNERRKVTSSAKRKRKYTEKSLHQTPEGSLLDIMRNAYDLLSHCDIELPEIEDNDRYVNSGPPYLILLHPALGPIWEVTRQKFNGGSISNGSELQIEVAEFLWRNVQLDGSLILIANNVMGSSTIDENGDPILQYGHRCGRCKLQNVKVLNEGIDWSSAANIFWKHDVQRLEAFKVILHGNAEFEAKDVILQGNHVFEVPDGYKLKITSGNPGLAVEINPIEQDMMNSGSWYWKYNNIGTKILLELVEL